MHTWQSHLGTSTFHPAYHTNPRVEIMSFSTSRRARCSTFGCGACCRTLRRRLCYGDASRVRKASASSTCAQRRRTTQATRRSTASTASSNFRPHGLRTVTMNDQLDLLDPDFKGTVVDYRQLVVELASRRTRCIER